MTVQDLLNILVRVNPDAEVVTLDDKLAEDKVIVVEVIFIDEKWPCRKTTDKVRIY